MGVVVTNETIEGGPLLDLLKQGLRGLENYFKHSKKNSQNIDDTVNGEKLHGKRYSIIVKSVADSNSYVKPKFLKHALMEVRVLAVLGERNTFVVKLIPDPKAFQASVKPIVTDPIDGNKIQAKVEQYLDKYGLELVTPESEDDEDNEDENKGMKELNPSDNAFDEDIDEDSEADFAQEPNDNANDADFQGEDVSSSSRILASYEVYDRSGDVVYVSNNTRKVIDYINKHDCYEIALYADDEDDEPIELYSLEGFLETFS